MENRKKWFWFFRCSGLTFESPDRGVAVGIGLAIALQSLPLAGVAIGKFNRGADQSSGSGGFARFFAVKFFVSRIFDLISLWNLSGFTRVDPIVKPSQNTKTSAAKIGEGKRLQCNSKPNSNSNPTIRAFES
jgi:hypothetical protein